MHVKTLSKTLVLFLAAGLLWSSAVPAEEVNKGGIPAAQLEETTKTLPWGVSIWDVDEAVKALKAGGKYLWVDTRPTSFFEKGTVRDAVNLDYDKSDNPKNTLNADSLSEAISKAGGSKEDTTVVFFCQGPTCHRSYNASYTAVTDWGYDVGKIIWYRSGYPFLFKAVKDNGKLRRKAKTYISDEGVKEL